MPGVHRLGPRRIDLSQLRHGDVAARQVAMIRRLLAKPVNIVKPLVSYVS
jgi:hypothetical protein